jgi:hypothetical protein
MEGENEPLSGQGKRFCVEAYAVPHGIHAAAEFGPLSVYFHPALPDQFFGGAPGSDPRLREKFLKPHCARDRILDIG